MHEQRGHVMHRDGYIFRQRHVIALLTQFRISSFGERPVAGSRQCPRLLLRPRNGVHGEQAFDERDGGRQNGRQLRVVAAGQARVT